MMQNPMQMFLQGAGPQTNDPLAMLIQVANNGGNPMALIQQMAMQNPQIAQAYRLIGGKSPQQLQTIAQNMASERGIDLNQMVQSLGLNMRR